MLKETAFLTSKYIEELLSTGQWSEHGASLDRFIEEVALPHLPEEVQRKEGDELLRDPAFTTFLGDWLKRRFAYCSRDIAEDMSAMKDERGFYSLSRSITCTRDLIKEVLAGDVDIGRYWSADAAYTYGVEDDESKPFIITVAAKVSLSDVDMVQTMRSRMDYDNGDDEREFYIKDGVTPVFVSVYVDGDDPELDGEIDCLTPAREAALNKKSVKVSEFSMGM